VAPFSGPTGQFQGLAWKLSAAPRRGGRMAQALARGKRRSSPAGNFVKPRQVSSSNVKLRQGFA
jgi:hypothetical protein